MEGTKTRTAVFFVYKKYRMKQKYVYSGAIVVCIIVLGIVTLTTLSKPTVNEQITTPTTTIEKEDVQDAVSSSETELPEFAYIKSEGDERILVNERDGYEIALEDSWHPEYYTNIVEIFVEDDYPSSELMASFSIIENEKIHKDINKMIEDRLRRYNEDCNNCYKLEEIQKLSNGKDIAIIKDYAAITPYYYMFIFYTEDKEYEIFSNNMEINNIIKLIETNNFK